MPAHRVIAGLSSLSQREIDNLRTALAASRKGQRVVVLPDKTRKRTRSKGKVHQNLRYLAEAVAWEVWQDSGIPQILRQLMSNKEELVAAADVASILVCQRCVAPASKLYAQRWFPKTALPELIGITPAQFHNTRIHRVLERLDSVDQQVQECLANAHSKQRGNFGAMFLDVTDTWFEGRGPELAETGKTKEGLFRRKVGIVLLCDELGYPLRWEVIRGRTTDSEAMQRTVEAIKKLDWAGNVPLALDRAMGRTKYVKALLDSDLRFVTVLTRNEFDSYTNRIPFSHVQQLEPLCTKASYDEDIQAASQAAEDAGMERVSENLYILDLGIIEKADGEKTSPKKKRRQEVMANKTVVAMERAQEMHGMLADGRAGNRGEAGAKFDYGSRYVSKLLRLLNLTDGIQRAVLGGEAEGLSLQQLFDTASLNTPEKQRKEFQRLLLDLAQRGPDKRRTQVAGTKRARQEIQAPDPLRVRLVVAFNPDMFVTQRRHAEEQLEEVHAFVRKLNRGLMAPQSQPSKESVAGEVAAKLRKDSLTEIFSVHVTSRHVNGRDRFLVELKRNDEKWKSRRRHDGYWLLVAHPDLLDTGAELCQLYRAKDMVEKDFQTIKSVLELRPVRHRTDSKVRAHVSLCMHALRVNRKLEDKLAQTLPRPMTAASTFETLRDVYLHQLQTSGEEQTAVLTITECSRDQRQILEALGLGRLADDDEMVARLTPR